MTEDRPTLGRLKPLIGDYVGTLSHIGGQRPETNGARPETGEGQSPSSPELEPETSTEGHQNSLIEALEAQLPTVFVDRASTTSFVDREINTPVLELLSKSEGPELAASTVAQELSQIVEAAIDVLRSLPRRYEMFLALCGVKHDDLTVGPVFLGRGLALHKPPRGGFLRGFKYEMHYLWVTGTLEGYWGSFPEWSLGIDLLVPQLLGLLEAAGLVELDLFSRAPTEKGSFLGVRELDTGRLVADRELPAELQELPYRYTTNERFTAARYDLATLQKEGWPERVSQIASSSLSFCEGILDSGEEGSRILSAASRLTASSVAEDRKEGLLDAATGLELLLGDAKSPISSHKLGDRLSLALKVDGDRRKAVMGDYSKAEGIKERVIRNDPAVSDKDHSWCRWKLRQLLKRVLIAEAWNLRQLGRPN